jgi:folate-binding protein YgfZ
MFSFDQYQAARASSIFFNRASRGVIALTGADRLSFLHSLLTNDIAKLTQGSGTYSAYLTPQGRMISDMRVLELGDRTLLGVEHSVVSHLAERLANLIFSEDVQVQNLSDELAEIGVHGPSAAVVIDRAAGVDAAKLPNQYDNVVVPGGSIVVRDDALGVTGFDIYVDRSRADVFRSALRSAGATEASDATVEVLRIEAGRPTFGVDMTTDTIPLEAGIEGRAISLTKGCYVGQEVIVRVLHRGHGRVARRLVGLLLRDGEAPQHGDAVMLDGKQVGEVTSGAPSPRLGGAIALAYVQRDHATAGTSLLVNTSGRLSAAEVHALPFA